MTRGLLTYLCATTAVGLVIAMVWRPSTSPEQTRKSIILQAEQGVDAADLARAVGGEVTHELGIINAVAVELSDRQMTRLQRRDRVRRIWDNRGVNHADVRFQRWQKQ